MSDQWTVVFIFESRHIEHAKQSLFNSDGTIKKEYGIWQNAPGKSLY